LLSRLNVEKKKVDWYAIVDIVTNVDWVEGCSIVLRVVVENVNKAVLSVENVW
jgi:hypothetical protein